MESAVVNDTLSIVVEFADDVVYSNTSDYIIEFINMDVGYSYSFHWTNGSFYNSSDYLDHAIVGNTVTCFFRWNTSFNESDFELFCNTSETEEYEHFWFDFAPDYSVPYLFYIFRVGFLRYLFFGRGFSYVGRNVHTTKSVNISITIEYQSLNNNSAGSSISDFSVAPQKFFGGHIRVPLIPVFARINATLQIRNFSQSWVGIKCGSWVFLTDVYYQFEQQPSFLNKSPWQRINRFFRLRKSSIFNGIDIPYWV